MKPLGLRGRVAVAVVAAVATACVGLSWGTLVWADANYRQSVADNIMLGITTEMRQMVDVIAKDPTADWLKLQGSIDRLSPAPLSVEAAIIRLEGRDSRVQPELALQYGFVNTDTPMNQRIPDCMVPDKVWLTDEREQGPEFSPGTFQSWIEPCGDYMMGFAYTRAGGDPGPYAWLLVHGYRMTWTDSPVPRLALALLVASLAMTGLAVLIARGVAASVLHPVTRAGAMANMVAGGDLSVRIPVRGDDDVAAMSLAINAMADRLTGQIDELERANAAQQQFVSDVAHELRTPTTALLASAEALEDPLSRPEAAALVAPQLRRLAALTEDLLEISRMDAGRAGLVTDRIDLVDLIAEVVSDSGAADRIVCLSPSELPLTTDPARLRVVLRNLVANALQHGVPPVTIALLAENREVTISVHDCGAGVPSELRERVFDRFVRGDASRHGTSSGLGLAIAAENARLLGAELALEPDGSTFTLRWQLPTLDRRSW